MASAADKRSKKRSAPSQTGPKGKKVQLDVPESKGKKRSQPVTRPVETSGDSDDEEDEGFEEVDVDEAVEETGESSQAVKDPNGAHDSPMVHSCL